MLAFRRLGRGCATALVALGACVSPLALDGRPCPCAEGFVCCASTNTCARRTDLCPSTPSRDAESQDASIAADGSDSPRESSTDGSIGPAADRSSTGEEGESASDAPEHDAPDAFSDAGDPSIDTSNESAAPIDAALETTLGGDAPNDRDAPTDAGVADERADGPTGEADVLASPSWQALGDLTAYQAGQYEFQVVGGVPFLGLHRFMFPGRFRTCVALRYDGSTWQQLGADLPGTEVLAFAVSSDGTPHMISNGAVQAFQQGQWRPLPDPAAGYLISAGIPALAFDRNNRLHALAFRSSTGTLAVVRFNGTTWDVLGSDDASGPVVSPTVFVSPIVFGFDATAPYVASHNNDTSQTEVRRFGGTTWDFVGGGPMPMDSDLENITVSRSGVVYVASASNGIARWWQGGTGPWTTPVTIGAYAGQSSVVPSLDLSADDALHMAYLTDRDPGPGIVPGPVVSRLSGTEAQDLSVTGLDVTLFESIKLKMARIGSRDVPYIAFERSNVILVRKLE